MTTKARNIIKKIRLSFKHRGLLTQVINDYLFFLENSDKCAWGSITQDEEEGIRFAVARARNYAGPIIEIGTLFGHTANLIATLKEEKKELIAIENFCWNPFHLKPDIHRQITKRTLRYVLDHCCTRIYDGNAEDFYSENTQLIPSLVFIDALHDYDSVKRDIDWAVSTGCPVISGHDYIDIYPGVIRAVAEVFGTDISLYGSVWIHEAQIGRQDAAPKP